MSSPLFDLMFLLVPIFTGCVFIFILMMMLSPKLKSKFMGRQLKAIKDGFTEDTVFCKHCGKSIEDDSKYCRYCGNEQK